jgi:hypothetical protein
LEFLGHWDNGDERISTVKFDISLGGIDSWQTLNTQDYGKGWAVSREK